MGFSRLLLLCAFVASAVAVPVAQREQCARHCTESNQFVLSPGSTYIYDYETTTVTTIKGTTQDKSQLQLTAQADIEVLSKCELALRLRGVTLKQSDPRNPEYLRTARGGREFSSAVERHIVKFSYQDGRIAHICPTADTPAWVTNIHRGVLSAFQTSMANLEGDERVIETDVSGRCSAEYRSLGRSWRGTITIRKVKDLNSCTDRQNTDTSLQSTPYTQGLGIKSLPMVTGTQECEQSIGSGILQSSSCTENHVFRPFSQGSGGAVTTVTQRLTYNTVVQRAFTGDDYRPTRNLLLFDHEYGSDNSEQVETEAELAMRELCQASSVAMSISVPNKFAALVYRLRKLNYDSMMSLYGRLDTVCPGNRNAWKFFSDAVPLLGTSSSVRFMTDRILRQEIPQSEVSYWLISLSFISEPSAEMISTITPLLDGRFEQAFLGASALIHTFCKGTDCSRSSEVRSAVERLVAHLGDNCYSSNDRKILLTLKALGNIGNMFGREGVLERCYQNPQIDTEVRLAAIQAYRRLSCDVSRESLLTTYGNYDEDTEIRIASYLASMQCISQEAVQFVKETLERESVNQVGSFVWTHLNALSKSKHPERRDIRDILSNLYLLNKYNTDIRKFSSAHEASMFLESINSGFHADSHLVFSPESYLPRSASFNLTVDIFGQTCNLFQIDGRLEGLERVVERMFGPNGYFPQRNVAKLLRERRSVSDNKIEKFDEQFDIKSRFEKEPYGSVDMKVFGNTLFYNQFGRGSTSGAPTFNFLELISDLGNNQEKEFSRSLMFMDNTFTIPLASGMPLRLAVNGTATVGLKVGGRFSARSFKHVDILGHFEPSGSVEIASLLTVDAGTTTRAGLRMIGTLHSSSVLDGAVEVRDGQVFKVQFNVPRDRIDLIDIQSKIFLVHGPEDVEQPGVTDDRTSISSCTGQGVKKVFGVELCTEVRLPGGKRNTPLYPISGPATFSIFLRKTDPSLTSYTFDSSWNKEEVNGQFVHRGIISLNTPGTSTDREISAELVLDQPERAASFRLKTPFKKFGMNAKYENENSQKKLDLSLTMDEVTQFSLRSELRVSRERDGVRYSPSLEIRLPSRRMAAIAGSAYLKHGQKYNIQLNVEDLTEKPITLRGNLEIKNRDRYEATMSLNSYALDTTIDGYTQLGDTSSCRFTVDYRIMEGRNFKVSLNGKLRDLSANALMKHSGVLNIQATALPEWDTALSWETMKTTGHFENTLSISIGDGVRSRVHTINMQEIIRYNGELWDNNAAVTMKLSYPEKNIDYSFSMNHQNTHNSLKNVMTVQYARNRELSTLVDINADTAKPLALSGDIKVQYPGRETRLTAEVTETSPNEYRTNLLAQWQRGRQMKFTGNYKDKSVGSSLKYEADAQITLPGHLPIVLEGKVGSNRGQYVCSAQITFGREKYTLNADYVRGSGLDHRFTSQLFIGRDFYAAEAALQSLRDKITGTAEVKFPNNRHITGKVDVKNSHVVQGVSFETMWDAERDPNRRFAFDVEVRPKASGFDGKVSVQVLKRTVKGTLSCSTINRSSGSAIEMNHKAELEWSPIERMTVAMTTSIRMAQSHHQVNGNVEVTTPFRGYESVTANIAHSDSDQQWTTQMSVLWDRTNRITFGSNGKYSVDRYGTSVYANAKLQTPFTNWELISVDLTHSRGPSEMSSRVEIQWSYDKKIAAGVFGSLSGSEFRGGANLTSPFDPIREIYCSVSHVYTSENYKTRGEFQWTPSKKIIIDFDGRSMMSSRRKGCAVNLAITTPFRSYEAISGKMNYNNDGSVLTMDSEVTINRDKINFGFTGTKRNGPSGKNMDGKLYFTSPFVNYERLEVSTTLQTTDSFYKTNVDAKLPHRMAASLNSQGKMTSWNDVEMNIVVSGKFNNLVNFQRASIDFAHKLQKPNIQSSVDIVYNNQRMTMLLTGRYNLPIVEGTLTVNTPVRGFEEMKLDVSHTQRNSYSAAGKQYESRVQFTKNSESLVFNHDLQLKEPYTFDTSFRLTSSFPSISDFKASVSQEYGDTWSTGRLVSSKFQHNVEIEWAKIKKSVLNIVYQNRLPSKDLTISLTTPYHQLRDVEVSASYEERRREIKPSVAIQWNGNRRMSLEGSFMNYRMQKVEGKLLFTSPFYGHELYQLSSKYDTTRPTMTAEMDFQWDRRNNKAISVRGNYVPSDTKTSAELIISTPFDDFDRITVNGNYENQRYEKSASLVYQRGLKKVSLNGKSSVNSNGAEFEINFSCPYKYAKDLGLSAKYSRTGQQLVGEANVQWFSNQQATLSGQYTPGRDISVALQRNGDQIFQASADMTLSKGEAVFNARVQSSFTDYRQMSFYGHYKQDYRVYSAEVKLQTGPRSIYQGNAVVKHNDRLPTELSVNIDSPSSPFKNVQLRVNVKCESGHHEISSNLKWEDKEMNAHILLRSRDGHFFETKMKLDTPFHNFRTISLEGTLNRDDNQFIDGRLNLLTPFDALRTLDLSCQLRSSSEGYNLNLNMNSPSKKLDVVAYLKNSRFQPFEAQLNIDAPFTTFRTLTLSSKIESSGLKDTKASVSLVHGTTEHSLSGSFSMEDGKLEMETKLESPLLKSGQSKFEAKFDYNDIQAISGGITLRGFGGDHHLELSSQVNRKEQVLETKMSSPMLPGRRAAVKISYSYRKNRNLDAKLILTLSNSVHQVLCRYDNDNRQQSVKGKIESNLLPFRTLDTEAKYINVNEGRDIELSIWMSTPNSRHAVTGNLKNYDNEKFFELKFECPMINVAPITLSGSFKNENPNTVEGVLTASYRYDEFRVAGNINGIGSDNVEAMMTMNTPFETLRMMRIDTKFSKNHFDSMEGSFQMETSNPNFRKLSFSGKLGRSKGSEDVSINIQLPNTRYHTLGLLANVHYNEDLTAVTPRVTLSLPQSRYSLYGDYKFSREFSLLAGYSWESNRKIEISSTFKHQGRRNFEGQISVQTPFRGYEQYQYSISYENDRRRHEVQLGFKDPRDKVVSAKGSLEMTSRMNFVAEGSLSSSFPSLRDVSARIRQIYDYRNFKTNVECIWAREKAELNLLHQFNNTHYLGNLEIKTPYRALREMKTSYSYMSNGYEKQAVLDVIYNRVRQLGVDMTFTGPSAPQSRYQMLLDLPRLPFNLRMNAVSSDSEQKFSFRSITTSRTVSFSTTLQNDFNIALHEASFSWDEEARKTISYILKSSNLQSRRFRGKELYGRLDFPLRSFEVKGNTADFSKSFGFDLFWDAARDRQKHMTFGYEHHDITSRDQTSHRIKLTLTHPSLEKEVVMTNIFTTSAQEIHLKSELEYSRYQQHHLSLEIRGSELSERGREINYKGEFSLKHPVSNVDIRVVGELVDNRDTSAFYLRLHNMDNQRLQRIKEFRSRITKSSKAAHIMLRSDDNLVTFVGRQINRGYEVIVSPDQDASADGNVYSSFQLIQGDRSLDVRATIPRYGVIQMNAAYPDESVSLRVSHITNGKVITDGYVFLGLEQSRVLRSHVNWRPGIWRQLQYETRERFNYLYRSLKQNINSVAINLGEEFTYKSDLISRHARDQLRPFIVESKKAIDDISAELIAGRDAVYTMYRNNEFYMKDIVRESRRIVRIVEDAFGYLGVIVEVLYNIVMEQLDELYYDMYFAIEDFLVAAKATYKDMVYKYYRFRNEMRKTMYRTWRRSLRAMDHAVDYAINKVELLGESLLINIDSMLRSYAPFIIDMYYAAKQTADAVRETIKNTADRITATVTNNPLYIALSEYWSKVMATFEAFQEADIMNSFRQQVLRQYASVRNTAQAFMNRVYDMNLVETVMNHPHVEYVGDVTNRALAKSLEMYNALGIDAMMKSLLYTGLEYAREAAFDTAQELLEELYQLKSGAKYTIEPERGLLSFEYTLPVSRNSLAEVLDIYSYPEYRKFNDFKDALITKYYEDFCIWDMYYAVKKYFTPRYWLPLTPAHAMIAGNQHYITFDKFTFDFASECSYLLTRDFVDSQFSVVVNYGREGRKAVRKSLTVLTEEKKFDISNDYKVTVDDVKVEMPLQRGNTIVTREGSNIRVENEEKGFVVVCNFVHNVCTLGMSSFYFGKTGGLFGTYDYEPHLDMMTPERRIATEVDTFVNSWEVGASTCRRSSNMATIAGNDYRVQEKCKEVFGTSSSIFRACFKQVDPLPYMQMCVSDLSAVHENQFDSAICTTAGAYWTECQMHGVPLKMPKSCVKCETADEREMTEGDVVKFTRDDPLHTADIVFVVEEKACNENKYKMLGKLSQSIEEAFRKKGYRDIRYSVIGFGGDTIHAKPHIHTMDGQISGTIRAVESAFESLTVGNGPVNVLEALRYAATLPFRPGTIKNFILLKCSTCRAEEVRAEYSEMLRTLLDGDITLHLLMEQNFEMKSTNKNTKAKKVIGVDRNFAYTLKDMKDPDLSGDGDMLAQLKIPKDVCVPLALEVNGTSFDSQQLTDMKRKVYKKFIDVLARRIQKTGSERSEWAMCCECISTVEGVGKSMCQRCVSAEVANMISPESSSFYNEISNNISDSKTR